MLCIVKTVAATDSHIILDDFFRGFFFGRKKAPRAKYLVAAASNTSFKFTIVIESRPLPHGKESRLQRGRYTNLLRITGSSTAQG